MSCRFKDTQRLKGKNSKRHSIKRTCGGMGWGGSAGILISEKIDVSQNHHKEYNGKRVNSPRRYNNYKYTCIQHQSIQIYEAYIDRTEGETDSNTILAGDFNTPLSIIYRYPDRSIEKQSI